MTTRVETDSMGPVEVPADKYYGAQTMRSRMNFQIGKETMPIEIVRAFGILKKAAAITNNELDNLEKDVCDLIKGDLATVLAVQIPAEAAGDND